MRIPRPETHADDIDRVIQAAVGSGPVDVLASSGGAVNMLAFVAAHPDVVRTPRRSRAAARLGIARPRGRDGSGTRCPRHLRARWPGSGDGQVPYVWSCTAARSPPTGPIGRLPTRRSSVCRRRTTARGRIRCSVAATSSTPPDTSPTTTRSGLLRRGWSWRTAPSRTGAHATRRDGCRRCPRR